MGTEKQPRKNETIVINADGERRIVPKTFLKNRKVMNQFGWREHTGPKMSTPEAKPKQTEIEPTKLDAFQDVTGGKVTDEANVKIQTKQKAGRPKNK